jgi:hypothetical protein
MYNCQPSEKASNLYSYLLSGRYGGKEAIEFLGKSQGLCSKSSAAYRMRQGLGLMLEIKACNYCWLQGLRIVQLLPLSM